MEQLMTSNLDYNAPQINDRVELIGVSKYIGKITMIIKPTGAAGSETKYAVRWNNGNLGICKREDLHILEHSRA